jgi:hypothetical protein
MKDHPRRPAALVPKLLLALPVVIFVLLYARAGTPPPRPNTKAGLIYLRIADPRHKQAMYQAQWPPWLPALEASAKANARSVTYYFVGAPSNVTCANCVQVPLDLDGLLARIARYLHITDVQVRNIKHKVCDLKPMWPVLFPEISARHAWVGFADADVLFGDLASEIDLLGESDDLLVPSSWHPYPLANGNFMLFRSTDRVLNAFRGAEWRKAVRSPGYSVFDEWHGRDGTVNFGHALLEMHLNGKLRPVHKSNFRGASLPLLNHDLHAIDATPARWRGGVVSHCLIWPARSRRERP